MSRWPLPFAALVLSFAVAACTAPEKGGGPSDERPDARQRFDAPEGGPPPDARPPGVPDAAPPDAPPFCPTTGAVTDPTTGNCFILVEENLTKADAQANCVAMGGHLASLTSARENGVGLSILPAGYFWIGLADPGVEGTYVWISGEGFSFTNWHEGEPNNANDEEDCVEMYGNYVGEFAAFSGDWNDALCTELYRSLCEKEAL